MICPLISTRLPIAPLIAQSRDELRIPENSPRTRMCTYLPNSPQIGPVRPDQPLRGARFLEGRVVPAPHERGRTQNMAPDDYGS